MTACYATDRRDAIHRLGDHYDTFCHPEIMTAFVYALNDSDERVRNKSADEIGDQIRRNRCVCGPSVICALTTTLADCDRGVRRQAEEALQLCGYKIVDGCCQPCCASTPSAPESNVWSGQSTQFRGITPVPAVEVLDAWKTDDSKAAQETIDRNQSDSVVAPEPPEPTVQTIEASSSLAPVESLAPVQPESLEPMPMPDLPALEAPAAPDDGPQAYFPSRLHDLKLSKTKSGLSTLLGLKRKDTN
jgi:hypothetical protein